jgi:hypothetical protein
MSIRSDSLVIDRFESALAVLVAEDGAIVEVPRSSLPQGARSGSVLRITRDATGAVLWGEVQIDEEATAERLAQAESVLEALRKRDPGGDVVL